MPRLPVLSGHELIRLLESAGFKVVRQKGSHVSLQKGERRTVVPLHDELAKELFWEYLNNADYQKKICQNYLKNSSFFALPVTQWMHNRPSSSPVLGHG